MVAYRKTSKEVALTFPTREEILEKWWLDGNTLLPRSSVNWATSKKRLLDLISLAQGAQKEKDANFAQTFTWRNHNNCCIEARNAIAQAIREQRNEDS